MYLYCAKCTYCDVPYGNCNRTDIRNVCHSFNIYSIFAYVFQMQVMYNVAIVREGISWKMKMTGFAFMDLFSCLCPEKWEGGTEIKARVSSNISEK